MDNYFQWEFFESLSDDRILKSWDAITLKVKNPTFYQNRAWYQSFLDSDYEKPSYYGFMMLMIKDTPHGIIPLEYLPIKRFGLELNAWRIFWPHDLGVNDFIIDQSFPVNCLIDELTLAITRICKKPWDLLILQDCPEEGAVDASMKTCRPRRSVSIYHHESKYLDCRNTDNNVLGKLSTKYKKNLRRLANKLKKTGEVSTYLHQNKSELDQAFSEFLKVESAGWKGEGETALMYDLPQRSFYEALLKYFGEQGRCVIHTLKLDGDPIASQFAVLSGDTYYMLKIGYDETFKASGPGSVLLEETIRHFSEQGHIKKISFVTGSSWQDIWLPESTRIFHHYIFNQSLKGYTVYSLEALKDLLRAVKYKIKKRKD
jgi:CelD/BcsL family acetyltransferase involved in cellulose biosynthesis